MSDKHQEWKLLFIAIITVMLAVIGPNAAMIIGFLSIPSAIVACAGMIFDKEKRIWKMRFVAYGGCFLLAISGPGGCALNTLRVERTAAPIITSLEQYRQKYGNYPEKLEAVASAQCSACSGGRFFYSCRDKKDEYHLTSVTYGMNKHIYDSKTQKWGDWD